MEGMRCFRQIVIIIISVLALALTAAIISVLSLHHGISELEDTNSIVGRAMQASKVTKLSCPVLEGSIDVLISGQVEIRKSNSSILCTLTEITSGSYLKPVARSYGGRDWETAAGDFVYMKITCVNGLCSFTLPRVPTGSRYQLTTFKAPSYTRKDQVARFLEQATFGPTLVEIGSFKTSNLQLSFAAWIKNQQTKVGITSHRAYYRRRMNGRFEVATPMGAVTHPCQLGTRYRGFAFSSKDQGKALTIESLGNYSKLIVDGFVRTVVRGPVVDVSGGTFFPDGRYLICNQPIGSYIGAEIYLENAKSQCIAVNFNKQGGNPSIQFDVGDLPRNIVRIVKSGELAEAVAVDTQFIPNAVPRVQQIRIISDLKDPICSTIAEPGNPIDLVFAQYDGVYWMHDPRHELMQNTPTSPIRDGGGSVVRATANFGLPYSSALCSNVAPSFLNEDTCVLSRSEHTCSVGSGLRLEERLIPLNGTTIQLLYKESGSGLVGTLYLYAIDGLRIESDSSITPPCKGSAKSRWIKAECSNSTVSVETEGQFRNLITNALNTDKNPNMIDVVMTRTSSCSIGDALKVGFTISAGGQCWRNVHPDHLNVYDFTPWTKSHPGNTIYVNPIKRFAENGLSSLLFPSSHELSRWQSNKSRFRFVGRLGDPFNYFTIPLASRTPAFNAGVGFDPVDMMPLDEEVNEYNSSGSLICGSPNEIANDPSYGGSDPEGAFTSWAEYFSTTADNVLIKQRRMVWTNIVLGASDQLRQRVAWALSQILVITPTNIRRGQALTEILVNYYDVFVRNAFGNYRDVLKEVAYSPVMANMLSYFNSKSTAYEFAIDGTVKYADENFAREIMQLFTIGLYKLYLNGVKVLDERNQTIPVYSNEDIVEYARVWTGFTVQQRRGNIEHDSENRIDPLKIEHRWRDPFPKMGLNRRYVGDGLPLCADLPEKHFLSIGAIYRLLGRSSRTRLHSDPESWAQDSKVRHLKLQPNGTKSLFSKLCGASTPSRCTFASTVILDDKLLCTARECSVDTIRVVEVVDGVFYEYHRPPCVNQAFYENPKLVAPTLSKGNLVCADPRTAAATIACCPSGSTVGRSWNSTFWGERATLASALLRCNGKLCTHETRPSCTTGEVGSMCSGNNRFWTNLGCTFRVKIDQNGNVAIVHVPTVTNAELISQHVGEDTKTFFRVNWRDSSAVNRVIANCSSIGVCTPTVDEMCLCPVAVSESQVFFDGDNPSRDEVLGSLNVGAFHPSSWSSNYTTKRLGEIIWYGRNGSMASDSVFSVLDDAGVTQLRKNVKLTVSIVASNISFRNPVHIVSLEDPEPRDAHFETEAALDHYFYHSNTAPFLATRLAQRFGISNPSPRYTERIATAFRTGLYSDKASNTKFGSGKYGDLAATVACILLDVEARDVLLDADPMHGSLREPLLKVIGLMRSMRFKATDKLPFVDFTSGILPAIGQMAHEIPDVFSFFLPGFKPSGVISQAALVAPEAQVATSPRIVNLVNGLLSMVKYGLDKCYGGFGSINRRSCSFGDHTGSMGTLKYSPTSTNSMSVINELGMMLTAGRLSRESRQVIEMVYSSETNKRHALVKALSLIVTTPEFHSTSIVRRSGISRPKITYPPSSQKRYKAVINVLLSGGVDSYNMLVPHYCKSTNARGNTLVDQYNMERTTIAFTNTERTRIINATGQPCEQFVIHPSLGLIETLYAEGDLSFFANAGVLNAPVTITNYTKVTKTTLFDHNSMQTEAQKIDPFDKTPGSGILGRMCGVLRERGFNALPMNVEDSAIATRGQPGKAISPVTVSEAGSRSFNAKPSSETFDPLPHLLTLNGGTKLHSSLFGETWSSGLIQALDENKKVRDDFARLSFKEAWEGGDYVQRMKTAAKLVMSSADRGTDRDAVFVELPGWDHHFAVKDGLSQNFAELNKALTYFRNEMVAQRLWTNVTLVVTSDFGRTLTANSGDGSDHGWGGHYFIMGGSVKGRQIHGQYPQDISEESPVNFGRGRIAPTTSWESIFNGIVEWMGIDDYAGLDYCLPNRNKTGTKLFTKNELFCV